MTNLKNDARHCHQINAIRAANGNPGTHCPTCARPAHDPRTRYVGGRIVEGCVDAFHYGHVGTANNVAAWYYSPDAREIRTVALRAIQ